MKHTPYHVRMTRGDIHGAIKRGDVLKVRRALEDGLDPNSESQGGWTLLMMAALAGNTAIGRELIAHGANLDTGDSQRWSALAYAAHTGHPGFVEMLVKSGASLESYPFGGSIEGFLDWATKYGTGSSQAMARTREIIRSASQQVSGPA